MMMRTKLPTHKHSLYPVPWVSSCNGCGRKGGYYKDGYRCHSCKIVFHKECAESPSEIYHMSHPEHPLYISLNQFYKRCKLCWQKSYDGVLYRCPTCDFLVDTACAKNPPPDVIEYPKAHEHSLVILKEEVYFQECDFCYKEIYGRYPYKCNQCQMKFHFECCNLPLEITHPCHPKHPVRFVTREDHHHFSDDGKCRICGNELGKRFYNCSICKFSVDVDCVRDPPATAILFAKAHEHQLNLMARNISFNCDACGMIGDRSPYSCHQCDFMIHQECIDLPEIINVNRHEHRLSRRIHLSPGSLVCGVCRQKVDWSYGAYSCSICPNYAMHSRCATHGSVWDGLELKGIPEETQEVAPFKEIHGNLLICHFSHDEHYLKLNEESIDRDGSIRCEACVSPIYSQAFYSCVQCHFILHKTCANLPRKKRHMCLTEPLTLICDAMKIFRCLLCFNIVSGFSYDSDEAVIDVKCGALSDSITHESHSCPLYYDDSDNVIRDSCVSCGEWTTSSESFSCKDCKFVLDFKCLTLPKTTKHWYDDHLLSLCYGNNTSCWCDICEEEINTMLWFYTCDICCVTFHTKCVLGDFSFLMPSRRLNSEPYSLGRHERCQVMPINPGFLPRCISCRTLPTVPFVLKVFSAEKDVYVCSQACLYGLGSDL